MLETWRDNVSSASLIWSCKSTFLCTWTPVKRNNKIYRFFKNSWVTGDLLFLAHDEFHEPQQKRASILQRVLELHSALLTKANQYYSLDFFEWGRWLGVLFRITKGS